ncbi:DUF5663 domain-containing protein [Microbacterium sp. PRC9]|uniref:DUF5663 domain-containing protein n=1 Tax=Microbacterium sp. PRC9 TaxID=2962591 RepID=UPI002881A7B7|nr:DUF5663 domain-containing protein [Microbacterium sp. PRC9]MDT0141965.1 DUF5663 domain-containing protein [Microbacterium sp. PRC9]
MELVDDRAFARMGLADLPDGQRTRLAERITELLQLRIGHRLAARMNDRQVMEFGRLFEADDAAQIDDRFLSLAPDNRRVVQEELDFVIDELHVAVEEASGADGE